MTTVIRATAWCLAAIVVVFYGSQGATETWPSDPQGTYATTIVNQGATP